MRHAFLTMKSNVPSRSNQDLPAYFTFSSKGTPCPVSYVRSAMRTYVAPCLHRSAQPRLQFSIFYPISSITHLVSSSRISCHPLIFTGQLEANISSREGLFNRLYSSDFMPCFLVRDVDDSHNSLANFNVGNIQSTSSKWAV